MPYRSLVILLVLFAFVQTAAADPAADQNLLRALSKWREWTPENGGKKMEAVTAALAQGASVNCVDEPGMSPLHYASAIGYPELVQLLLARGADPNRRNIQGRTPLLVAASNTITKWNLPVVATLLMSKGADPTSEDNEGRSALLTAAGNPDAKILANILAGMTNLDARSNQISSLLLEAGRTRNPAAMTVLYNAGATLDAVDGDNLTVLMRALPILDAASMQHLVGAAPTGSYHINRRGPGRQTAMMMAAKIRDLETVKLLVEAGANLALEDKRCLSARDHALDSTHAEREQVVAFLEQRHAPHGIGHWHSLMLGMAIFLLLISFVCARLALKKPKPAE